MAPGCHVFWATQRRIRVQYVQYTTRVPTTKNRCGTLLLQTLLVLEVVLFIIKSVSLPYCLYMYY